MAPDDGSPQTGGEAPPPAPSQGRRGQRQWQTRQRLIKGARNVFARVGVAEATIAQITTEADIGFGTFYLYFKTKDDALHAVLVEGFLAFNVEVDEIQGRAEVQGQPWEDTLQSIVAAYLRFAQENRDLMQIMFAEQVRVQQAEWQVFLRFAWRIVQLLNRAGVPLSEDTARFASPLQGPVMSAITYPLNLLTMMIVAMLNRAAIWWLRQNPAEGELDAYSLEVVSTTVTQFIISGLSGVQAMDQKMTGKDPKHGTT